MFALEHALLVRQLEQRRRPERRADGEQRQRRLLRFAILSVQHFDAAPNVQSLRKNGEQKKSILQNQVQARQGPSQRSIPNSFAYRFGMDTSGPVRTSQVNLEVNAQLCRIVLTCKYWIQYVGDCFPFDNGRRGRRERWNIGIYEVLFLCVSVLLKRVCMESFMCSFSRCHGAASKPTSQLFPTHHLGERHPSSLHSRLDPNFGATQSLETEKTTTTQQKKLGRKPGKTPNRIFFRR